MHRLLWLALLLMITGSSPAAAQDGSLGVTLSLEANRAWKSEAWTFYCLVEFQNRLKVPLRWHPAQSLYEGTYGQSVTRLCFQSTDGRRYIHWQQRGFGPEEVNTAVLPPGASHLYGTELCEVIETDAEWQALPKEDGLDDRYRGPLPEGTYDVWVRYFDGPDALAKSPERAPAEGVYLSNKVRFTVVPDGTPDVAQSLGLLEADGPRMPSYPFVRHGSTRMVWARHLAAYGVRAVPDDASHTLVLNRVGRRILLPRLVPIDGWMRKGAPPAPALCLKTGVRDEEDYLVPLDYVEGKLGIRVTEDRPRKK